MRKLYYAIILLFSLPSYANGYMNLIEEYNTGEIDKDYIYSLMFIESSFNPNARSDKDCLGLMQIHLDTARDLGFKGKLEELFIPAINVKYSIKYIYWIYKRYKGHKNRLYKTFDAYNRGIGNVKKWPYKKSWRKHRYVGKIISRYEELTK